MRYLLLLSFLISGFARANTFDRLIATVISRAETGNMGGFVVKSGSGNYPRSGQLGRGTILSLDQSASGYRWAPHFSIDVGGSNERGGRHLIFAFYSHPITANQARAAARADRVDARIHEVLNSYGATPLYSGTRISGLSGNAPLVSHRENVEIVLTQQEALKLDLGAIEEIIQAVARTR
jgi:hypothetical protein